jgi:succinate-semialdehyde dehydrogenase / glutarate-semialdehyde dehydrogenase
MATTQTRRDERLLIGGEWVDATGSGRFDVTNPATGEVVGSTPDATADDVRAAIEAAAAALDDWRNASAQTRARLLRKSADVMRERIDEIGTLMTLEQGKPLAPTARSCRRRTPPTACSCCARASASWPRSRRGTSRLR